MRRASSSVALVLSCEHGGNHVPAPYRDRFAHRARILESHRGWDPGALALAREIEKASGAPLVYTTVSRLVVECNRSMGHPQLFSEFTRDLDARQKQRILDAYYHPHRRAVERVVSRALHAHGRVVHVGVHTFTPVFEGKRRAVDIGVLYDPHRAFECAIADRLIAHIRDRAPSLRVRRNLPYRGWTDALTTTLRRRFPAARYAGIELEVSHALATGPRARHIRRQIAHACNDLTADLRS
jgi:predicted N-formylglutamate amidohydrolase